MKYLICEWEDFFTGAFVGLFLVLLILGIISIFVGSSATEKRIDALETRVQTIDQYIYWLETKNLKNYSDRAFNFDLFLFRMLKHNILNQEKLKSMPTIIIERSDQE